MSWFTLLGIPSTPRRVFDKGLMIEEIRAHQQFIKNCNTFLTEIVWAPIYHVLHRPEFRWTRGPLLVMSIHHNTWTMEHNSNSHSLFRIELKNQDFLENIPDPFLNLSILGYVGAFPIDLFIIVISLGWFISCLSLQLQWSTGEQRPYHLLFISKTWYIIGTHYLIISVFRLDFQYGA